MMDVKIAVALITGGATILAALIGVVGVALILWNRRTVIRLCKEVESYHGHEGRLVTKLLQNNNETVTEEKVKHWRGKFRNELTSDYGKPMMTAREARSIRQKYGSFGKPE
jgi:hypothetical protein